MSPARLKCEASGHPCVSLSPYWVSSLGHAETWTLPESRRFRGVWRSPLLPGLSPTINDGPIEKIADLVGHTPYFYGDDGNWLVTSFLTPGVHTFTVQVITTDGRVATDTVKASVTTPPAPPAALAGTWTRVVTTADVQKATSGQPPPPGRWQLQIGPLGWHQHDPTGGSLLFDVGYRPGGDLQMRPAIDYPPYPENNQGGFCTDTDPLWAWT